MAIQKRRFKFSIGDEVYLLATSKWAVSGDKDGNPVGVKGVVDNIVYIAEGCSVSYEVAWSNGRHNSCYTDDCLAFAKNILHLVEGDEEFSKVVG